MRPAAERGLGAERTPWLENPRQHWFALDAAGRGTVNFPRCRVGTEAIVLGGQQVDDPRAEIRELRASRRRMALAFDAERRGFERALHDGVQQRLVGIAANLELATRSIEADPAAAKDLLLEMGSEAGRALEETRALAQALYPPLLEAGGLVPALRSAALSADVAVRIDAARGPAYPAELAGAVYFCCLDVIEAAQAGTTVSITVGGEEGAVAFEIAADLGPDAERLPLRDRIETLGGRCAIEPGSGGATRVLASLPLTG
jgi:signal transduction histidine kinase